MTVDICNGHTKPYGIIGDPIEHSFSPVLQNTLASLLGENASYIPFKVDKANLETAVKGAYALGIQGLNVTVPHKKEVMKYIYKTDESAAAIGAVNTLKYTQNGYAGYNTDILGFEKSCEINGIDIKGRKVMLLGCGGAANAVAMFLCKKKASEITIINRTSEKAESLKKIMLHNGFCGAIKTAGYEQVKIFSPDILINATSVGMGNGCLQSPLDGFVKPEFFNNVNSCIDVIYIPWETKLLNMAKNHGCKTVNGFDMLVYQGIASFEIWHDIFVKNETAKEIRDSLAKYFIEVNS